ncbi:MAG: protease modulator HflC [Candidatus Midichloria sp.]|nr:protease modulator HflC [Candidatus Midichloria sp.]
MTNKMYQIIGALLLFLGVMVNSVYILDQRQTALVLQFGEPVRQELTPGLKFKIPLMQNVIKFDKRIQHLTFSPGDASELMALDQKTMKLDAFAKYRITNPLKFYQSVQNDQKLKMRIGSVIESSVREVVGTFPFIDVLGSKRTVITNKITELVKKQAENFGINIIDVRIVRVNLPDKARDAVYNRMRTDRLKEAKEIRAQGAEEALAIKANADKEKTIILAEAKKQSEILKGNGDAASIKIFSSAVNSDPEFFSFYRSLEAYKNTFKPNTSIVLSSDSPFMKYFNE